MKKIILFSMLLSSVSCTTVTFVRKDFSPQKQAVLKYSPTDDAKKEEKYKAKVAEESRKFCGGDYTINKEYQAREATGTSTGVGTGFGVGFGGVLLGTSQSNTAMYNFVEVSCNSSRN